MIIIGVFRGGTTVAGKDGPGDMERGLIFKHKGAHIGNGAWVGRYRL